MGRSTKRNRREIGHRHGTCKASNLPTGTVCIPYFLQLTDLGRRTHGDKMPNPPRCAKCAECVSRVRLTVVSIVPAANPMGGSICGSRLSTREAARPIPPRGTDGKCCCMFPMLFVTRQDCNHLQRRLRWRMQHCTEESAKMGCPVQDPPSRLQPMTRRVAPVHT